MNKSACFNAKAEQSDYKKAVTTGEVRTDHLNSPSRYSYLFSLYPHDAYPDVFTLSHKKRIKKRTADSAFVSLV